MRPAFKVLFIFALATTAFAAPKKAKREPLPIEDNETSESADEGDTGERNVLFYYTHLLPSPFTLRAGQLVLGTDVALGVTDFFQVGTNLIQDFYQVWNAHAKLSVFDNEAWALGLFTGFQHYNYKSIDDFNPDLKVTSWLPGLTLGYSPYYNLAWFFGGNLNFTNTELKTDMITTSGFVNGARLNTDLSWAYNPKRNGVGSVLSSGVSYDLNYRLWGIGVSHHWKGFHLGLHYYPDAKKHRLQPILSGGAAINI